MEECILTVRQTSTNFRPIRHFGIPVEKYIEPMKRLETEKNSRTNHVVIDSEISRTWLYNHCSMLLRPLAHLLLISLSAED